MNPTNTAVLVIDIQNDFCHEKGAFAKLGINVKPAQQVTPKIQAFIKEIRKLNLPIIYSKQIESKKLSPKNLQQQFKTGKLKAVCAPNSWGSEFYKLKPTKNEHIIEKYTYDVFSNPKLNQILKKLRITTLIITDINTDVCIDTTIRSAFTHGYEIIVPKDLIATMNPKGEKYYLDIFNKFFGTVTTSKELLTF